MRVLFTSRLQRSLRSITDFDDDMQICRDNICEAIERLAIHKDARNHIFKTEQLHIANLVSEIKDWPQVFF